MVSQVVKYGRGARGWLIEPIQTRLYQMNILKGQVDGIYGTMTERAVSEYQNKTPILSNLLLDNKGGNIPLVQLGYVDPITWKELFSDYRNFPTDYWSSKIFPDYFSRALMITSRLEGGKFSSLTGDFDDMGISWGLLQWNLGQGTLQELLLKVPDTVWVNMEENNPELRLEIYAIKALKSCEAREVAPIGVSRVLERVFSDMTDGSKVLEPYKGLFDILASYNEVKRIQVESARDKYWKQAQAIAGRFGIKSSVGMAMCFDIAVQNWNIKSRVKDSILKNICVQKDEKEKRRIIAYLIANSVSDKWSLDVLQRKLLFSTGSGYLHGSYFNVTHWGLGEVEDELPPHVGLAVSSLRRLI